MNTTTAINQHCDKCGRVIDFSKGYTMLYGWKICGICLYEDHYSVQKPLIGGIKNPSEHFHLTEVKEDEK